MHHPTDRITHTMAFVTPVVEHWLEREIAQLLCEIQNVYLLFAIELFVSDVFVTQYCKITLNVGKHQNSISFNCWTFRIYALRR